LTWQDMLTWQELLTWQMTQMLWYGDDVAVLIILPASVSFFLTSCNLLLLATRRDCSRRGQLQSVEGGGCCQPVLLLCLLLMIEGDDTMDGANWSSIAGVEEDDTGWGTIFAGRNHQSVLAVIGLWVAVAGGLVPLVWSLKPEIHWCLL
jgi:hypothetical protein